MLKKLQHSRYYLTYILILVFLCGLTPASYGQVTFLNDRAADMTGATMVKAPALVILRGLTGRGQIIGLADSGLDRGSLLDMHPDLQSVPGEIPKVVALKSLAGRSVPDDPIGHGTHMAATIAGTGKASEGRYRGMAPLASLYVQSLLNENGQLAMPSNLESLFGPAYAAGVRLHVNGWGGGKNQYGPNSQQIDHYVRQHPDFLPIFGAGNSGPGAGSLTSEANSKNALVVGASQIPRPSFSPESRYAGEPASFSSRGPAADGRIKPDLIVPASAVISACSRLTESNFAANDLYTRMGGTSMAAAISGGAGALLSQYLEDIKVKPSAALTKALLINGVRPLPQSGAANGFGLLDIAGTILSLEDKTVAYADEKAGIAAGEVAEYRFRVTDPQLPVQVTLAWTDPAAAAGKSSSALVNNLDLIVIGPNGVRYYGNHFLGLDEADTKNNVEQIRLPLPAAGEYVVKVRAASVSQGIGTDPARPRQDYAVVYGQALRTAAVLEASEVGLSLAGGGELDLNGKKITTVVDGTVKPFKAKEVLPGSDAYIGINSVYLGSRTWKSGGIQVLSTPAGVQVMEINREVRRGGFFLDDEVLKEPGRFLFLNGQPVKDSKDIPPGVEVRASVSPSTQTLWQVKAGYTKKTGVVRQVNLEAREIQLLDDGEFYQVAPWAAFAFVDEVVDSGLADAPYGTAEGTELQHIMPGMPVEMWLSPATGEVQYISVQRRLVQGQITKVEESPAQVILETGSTYNLFSGTRIVRDEEEGTVGRAQPGDYLKALLMPDSDHVFNLQVYSGVVYGQVIYASEKEKKLYLSDHTNRFHTLGLNSETRVFRWNLPVDASAVTPGSWVRVILGSDQETVKRIDIAEVAEESTHMLAGYNSYDQTITTVDGSTYTAGRTTLVSKGGYAIEMEDLVRGEKVKLVTLSVPQLFRGLPVLVEAERGQSIFSPTLSATAQELNGVLIIEGNTTANRVYLYRQDGSRVTLEVEAGRFSRVLSALPEEKEIQLVAVDNRSGAISDIKVSVFGYPVPVGGGQSFNDLDGYQAEDIIKELGEKGIIQGYPDGSFRPQQPVTRLELACWLVRAGKIESALGAGATKTFRDIEKVPPWARGVVVTAQALGLIAGYPDGSFRPYQAATRTEVAVLVNRAYGFSEEKPAIIPPFQDFLQVPGWARDEISQAYQSGFLGPLANAFPGYFSPARAVTRGEAAVVIKQALKAKG